MSNQVQPVNVYPSPNVIQPQQQQSSSHHSNGSFGPVFIVLAVIFVLAIIATILGRICSRRRGNKAEQQPPHGHGGGGKKKAAKSTARPHDHKSQSGPEGDIEFGFHEKRIPTSKVAANNNGDPRGPKMPSKSHSGEHKGHVRFNDDDIEFRPGH